MIFFKQREQEILPSQGLFDIEHCLAPFVSWWFTRLFLFPTAFRLLPSAYYPP
jgi:hypothetical protein